MLKPTLQPIYKPRYKQSEEEFEMYEAPVEIIRRQVAKEFDDAVENEIQKFLFAVRVNVNKEELIKALKYDRGQYDKGYADGYSTGVKEFAERMKRQCAFVVGEEYWEVLNEIDNLVKEMVGGQASEDKE